MSLIDPSILFGDWFTKKDEDENVTKQKYKDFLNAHKLNIIDMKRDISIGRTRYDGGFNDYRYKKYDSIWEGAPTGVNINNQMIKQMTRSIDTQLLESLKDQLNGVPPQESEEEKVVRILKGDFEKKFGMTFEKFIEIYNGLLENNPEKLI